MKGSIDEFFRGLMEDLTKPIKVFVVNRRQRWFLLLPASDVASVR